MNVKMMPTSSIIPYAKNPRINDLAVAGLASSIKEFGFQQPLVIDSENTIIAGHTRLKAAIKLGLEKVPCVVANELTPTQIKAYRILDNKLSEKSQWDNDLLAAELTDLADFDFEPFDVDFSIIGFGIEDVPTPELSDQDKLPFREMTFTLHDDQYDEISRALSKAKKIGVPVCKNQNENGNAIAFICGRFINGSG